MILNFYICNEYLTIHSDNSSSINENDGKENSESSSDKTYTNNKDTNDSNPADTDNSNASKYKIIVNGKNLVFDVPTANKEAVSENPGAKVEERDAKTYTAIIAAY